MHNLNRPRSWYGGCRTHIRGSNIEQIRWLNYLAPMLRLGQSHFMMRIDEMVREGQEQGPKHNRSISLDKNSYVLDIRLRRDYWALSRRRGLENSTSAIIRPCCRLAAARAWFATCEKWKVPLAGNWTKIKQQWVSRSKQRCACLCLATTTPWPTVCMAAIARGTRTGGSGAEAIEACQHSQNFVQGNGRSSIWRR